MTAPTTTPRKASSASSREDAGAALPRPFDGALRRVAERVVVAVAMGLPRSGQLPCTGRVRCVRGPRVECALGVGHSDGWVRLPCRVGVGMLGDRRKDVPVLLRALLAAVLVLAVAACGDEPEREEALERVQPTTPCAEAFAGAAPATDDPTIPSDDEERDTAVTNRELDTVSLARLEPTLEACEDVEDWLAGAREHRGALPSELDGVSALRFMCDALESGATVCEEVAVSEDVDDAGVEDPETSSP